MADVSSNNGGYARSNIFDRAEPAIWQPPDVSPLAKARMAVRMGKFAEVAGRPLTDVEFGLLSAGYVDSEGPQPQRFREDKPEPSPRRQFVYYVDMYGDAIKIGFTTQRIEHRLTQLRRNSGHLLAVEPDQGRAMEKARHRQFKALRRGNTEDFERGDALLEHIEAMRATYGEASLYL